MKSGKQRNRDPDAMWENRKREWSRDAGGMMLMVHRHAKMKEQEDGMHSLKMERRVHDAMQEDAGNKRGIKRRRASQVLIAMMEHCVAEHKIKRKNGRHHWGWECNSWCAMRGVQAGETWRCCTGWECDVWATAWRAD